MNSFFQSRLVWLRRQRWMAMLLCWFSLPVLGGNLSLETLHQVEAQYGSKGLQRIARWEQLVWDIRYHSVEQQLSEVNDYFNQLRFIKDRDHWQQEDYWATPIETLASNGGDCEDFAIAKYFTLRQLGIPSRNLRITYVKALKINEPHMVLTYYPERGEPLVMDILVAELLPASRRTDLQPVYSFNVDGLWQAKNRNEELLLGSSDEIAKWRNMKLRLGMNTL